MLAQQLALTRVCHLVDDEIRQPVAHFVDRPRQFERSILQLDDVAIAENERALPVEEITDLFVIRP